ncbi:hypothetical protein [Nocardiopsis sp. CNT312]|uniref:hypothetical protein n=1 Tax=Nocardiopsis sp. CNT312 TaxID=1137268 RepID=UPI0004BBB8C7|nr:hypothetical protein [Nocardiopsis sp. CNT312]
MTSQPDPSDEFENRLRAILAAEADSCRPSAEGLNLIRERTEQRRITAWFGLPWLRPAAAVAGAVMIATSVVLSTPQVREQVLEIVPAGADREGTTAPPESSEPGVDVSVPSPAPGDGEPEPSADPALSPSPDPTSEQESSPGDAPEPAPDASPTCPPPGTGTAADQDGESGSGGDGCPASEEPSDSATDGGGSDTSTDDPEEPVDGGSETGPTTVGTVSDDGTRSIAP